MEMKKKLWLVEASARIETGYLSYVTFLVSLLTFNDALPSTDYVWREVLTAVSMNSPVFLLGLFSDMLLRIVRWLSMDYMVLCPRR
jgi:hypothetical protein